MQALHVWNTELMCANTQDKHDLSSLSELDGWHTKTMHQHNKIMRIQLVGLFLVENYRKVLFSSADFM